MSQFGSPFNRRSLIVGGFSLPLAAGMVSVTGTGIALADGTDAPTGGDTTIVDTTLAHKKTVGSSRATAKQVQGFTTLAAATWTGQNPDTVEFQAQAPDGTWGEWVHAELLTDQGIRATDATWVGPSQAVNVRALRSGVDVTAELTAHLIATSAAPSDFGKAAPAGSTGLTLSPGTSFRPGGTGPIMFSRAEWGADETWARDCDTTDQLRSVIVHHTAGSTTYSRSESAQQVRGIYAYHTRTLGWSDIGYNVLVDKYGQIFEGRRGGLEKHVDGAHAYGYNYGSFGISVLGTYQTERVPTTALHSVARLAAWKLNGGFVEGVHETATYRVTASNVRYSGQTVDLPRVIGHRDVNYTDCPGNAFYSQFTTLRTLVATFMDHEEDHTHLDAFTAAGGENTLGTVFQIASTEGAFRVTRLTKGLVITGGTTTRGYQSSFAKEWKPAWGTPLESTPGEVQRFSKGTARRTNGKVTFTAPTTPAPAPTFVDVPDSHVFAEYINGLAARGIVRGWSDGTFRPNNDVLRDQAMTFLYRISGSPAYTPPRTSPFRDLPTNFVFYKEISWAFENGLANGWTVRGGREFRPYQPMLRDQMAAFLSRAANAHLSTVSFDGFVDVPRSQVFSREIRWMGQTGISRGWTVKNGAEYRPYNRNKRGELAAFLYRFMEYRGLL